MSTAFQTYHEPRTQTGYALLIRWGQRYTSGFGLTLESHFGIGAQLTCYDITAFEFQGSVGTRREASELRVGFVPHLVLGPGYDFEPLLDVPLHIYTRPGVMVIYPDSNLAFQTGLIAELGVRWTPRL